MLFDTHKLNENGFKAVENFKTTMKKAVQLALKDMPNSREKAFFKVKIEEAMFFGTKAFAKDPKNHSEIITYE